MKYIDAEKLIVEIERRMKCYDKDGCEPNDGKWVELVTMKHFIESLQQEQPEVDLEKVYDAYCKVCGHYHHTTPAYICRQACDYFKNFKSVLNARKEE